MKTDVVLCKVCVSQGKKRNLTFSTKKEEAFISTGFLNWKKSFRKIAMCVSMSSIRETNKNLVNALSSTLSQEKFDNRQMLLKILENVEFLGRPGLPLKGNENEGNFDQLLLHTAKSDSRVTVWLKKKKGKYTHSDIQNEYLKIIALSILRDISSSIQNGLF